MTYGTKNTGGGGVIKFWAQSKGPQGCLFFCKNSLNKNLERGGGMPRPRQPTDLLLVKGKKHLTKKEIEERKNSEVVAPANNVEPPNYLPAALKKEFTRIANELIAIGIMSNLDNEALARFLVSEYNYQKVTKKLLKLGVDNPNYMDILFMQEKVFKMARSAASDLGLTISSRCKLVVPKKEEKPKNKFEKFKQG